MDTTATPTAVPDPGWAVSARIWADVLDRYTAFLQVPALRVSLYPGGKEKPSSLSQEQSERLRQQMLAVIRRLGGDRTSAKPSYDDLHDLWQLRGRRTPRSERCPLRLQGHFQRAFLLNAAGYRCCYCHRTAWGVYAETRERERPRTLRFEVDHKVTRQRLRDPEQFDPTNLVAACRSCNVIKAELPIERFLEELASLSRAVVVKNGDVTPK
jgi:5-methylcytosine-specific restriction endonuclease McrA